MAPDWLLGNDEEESSKDDDPLGGIIDKEI